MKWSQFVVRRAWRVLPLVLCLAAGTASAALPAGQPAELVRLEGRLAGTLQMPQAQAKVPVALIIAGSGPTDRDGNIAVLAGQNNSLKMLAEALAGIGVASLRYDKRGIAASSAALKGGEQALRFETLIDDAAGWIAQLRNDGRFSKVVVIGHSEGSLIGMLAAKKAGADAFISLAGIADDAPAILRRQLAGKLPPDLAQHNERILAALVKGEQAGDVPAALAALYRPSVQPYLISWFRYQPRQIVATLDMPVLVVQGDTDIQVGVEQAEALKAAQPRAQLAILPGMNHVLKTVPADPARQMASYADPALPLDPALAPTIQGFLKQSRILAP